MASLLAWLVNSVFYGFYFGGGIQPTTDRMLFFAYMSIWAGLHLYVALRLGLLPTVVFVFVANVVYDTPFSLERWYFDSALFSFVLMTLMLWALAGCYLSGQRRMPSLT